MKNILIEGWRGINHSYAMVNQYQLLELAKLPDLSVFHRDVSFGTQNWNKVDNNPNFPEAMRETIQAVPTPQKQKFDTIFRIAWPFQRSDEKARKTLTFLTAEYGLGPEHFPPAGPSLQRMIGGNASVVTPSNWSKMKLLEFGFPEHKVDIVPHGVSSEIFYPLTLAERNAVRQNLGLSPSDFVFLNLGAMVDNKGIDILLLAFSVIRKRHPNARLVLKDEQKLYRIKGYDVLQQIMKNHPGLSSDELLTSIKLLSVTLPMHEMRHLYGIADVYASPYRAEGFNLPVIEAIACGTPVIVTAGGSTDDFCEPRTATSISARHIDNVERGFKVPGYTLEPNIDSLIQAMEDAIAAPRANTDSFNAGRMQLIKDFSWAACVQQLVKLF
ncbi:MAG: glycosyltransferase family 4 protein [Proteobacteria bacterium]|nr:glycosyltransferase family 4 protein [Pseudomonadota bacterium]